MIEQLWIPARHKLEMDHEFTGLGRAIHKKCASTTGPEHIYRGGTGTTFDATDKRFDAMDRRFGVMDEKFDVVDKEFGVIDKRFGVCGQEVWCHDDGSKRCGLL